MDELGGAAVPGTSLSAFPLSGWKQGRTWRGRNIRGRTCPDRYVSAGARARPPARQSVRSLGRERLRVIDVVLLPERSSERETGFANKKRKAHLAA